MKLCAGMTSCNRYEGCNQYVGWLFVCDNVCIEEAERQRDHKPSEVKLIYWCSICCRIVAREFFISKGLCRYENLLIE